MKSTIATLSLLLLIINLVSQVSLEEVTDHHFDRYKYANEFQSSAVRRALAAVKFGLQTLKREETNNKNALRLETLGLTRTSSKICNFTDIESNFADLVEVTVDFASDAASSLETISDLINICATTSFPKSISCFLDLAKNIQPDVQNIKDALQTFLSQAHILASGLLVDIVNCYH